jgi:hypothetical protein
MLADLGFETHLFFVGDPRLPGEETHGRLTLHRWAQWISAYHPRGVYDGEEGKRRDLAASLPPYLVDRVIVPAVAAGRIRVVLSEEWQAAEFACRLSDAAAARGVRDRAVLVWNANNPYAFDRIDWPPPGGHQHGHRGQPLHAEHPARAGRRRPRDPERHPGPASPCPKPPPGRPAAPVRRRAVQDGSLGAGEPSLDPLGKTGAASKPAST